MSRIFIAILAATALCACHSPQAPQPDNAPKPQSESSVVMNSPLGPLLKDRDRAKAVQDVVDKQAAQQSKDIDDQSH
jgi:hypothetical protein